jgi:hypothetical protein
MVYMPVVASLISSSPNLDINELRTTTSSPELVENLPIFLPSSLPPTLHPQLCTTGIAPGLLDKEIKLRIAQADDALAKIRCHRRVVTGLVLFKKLNVSGAGQKKNTQIRSLFKRFNNKTESAAERYCTARQALLNVNAEGNWRLRLQELRPEDI